jgi:hypothetical protein
MSDLKTSENSSTLRFEFEPTDDPSSNQSESPQTPPVDGLSLQLSGTSQVVEEIECSNALVDSEGLKFVPLALSLSDMIYQISFVQQGSVEDDRTIMERIQEKYWEIRGKWNKFLCRSGIWLGPNLRRVGPVQVRSPTPVP